MNIERPTSNDE